MESQKWLRQGSSRNAYVVFLREDGRISCDCMGWVRKRPNQGRSCKHTKEIAKLFTTVQARDDGEFVLDDTLINQSITGGPAVISKPSISASPVIPATSPTVFKPVLGGGAATPEQLAEAKDILGYRSLTLATAMPADKTFADYCNDEWWMEEKYDGQRCLVRVAQGVVSAWSRAGRDNKGNTRDGLKRDLAPQIIEDLRYLPDGYYDGEIIVKGDGISSDVARIDNRASTLFVIFDILESEGTDITEDTYQFRRSVLLSPNIFNVIVRQNSLDLSERYIPSQTRLDEIWAAGGEGVVLKHKDSIYNGSRNYQWIKVKQHDDLTAEIIGFEDSKINGQKDAIILYAFEHPTLGRIESKCKVLNNEWSRRIAAGDIHVGTMIEVSYQILLPSGKPRHGMAKRIVGEA